MQVHISQKTRSLTQSGRSRSRIWMVAFESQSPKRIDPLTGWVGGTTDTACQVCLLFNSKEGAIAYAKRHGYVFTITEPPEEWPVRPKSYADNFRTLRTNRFS